MNTTDLLDTGQYPGSKTYLELALTNPLVLSVSIIGLGLVVLAIAINLYPKHAQLRATVTASCLSTAFACVILAVMCTQLLHTEQSMHQLEQRSTL